MSNNPSGILKKHILFKRDSIEPLKNKSYKI